MSYSFSDTILEEISRCLSEGGFELPSEFLKSIEDAWPSG
jgi:hypothetical protein